MTGARRLAVALSGGVDSAVSCRLIQDEGHEVVALFMELGQGDVLRQRARAMADFLGVDFQVVDLRDPFRHQVIDYFCQSYARGQTPNPCVVCNPAIKCGLLLDMALEMGCEALVTGHYVRQEERGGVACLRCGLDPVKDQSYFLCGLRQDQLRHLRFPLGGLLKSQVFALAREYDLPVAGGESQDVCFLEEGSPGDFLARELASPPLPGDIVDSQGRVLGRHQGIHCYTIGQRRGLGISAPKPLYVVAIRATENQVVVGPDAELYRAELRLLEPVNWLAGEGPGLPWQGRVKIRYRHQEGAKATLTRDDQGLLVRFAQPQRAITPGQFAVFYQDDLLLGGGEIVGAKSPSP